MTHEQSPLFDPTQLREMLNGDTEGIREVLIVFLKSTRKLTKEIESTVPLGDAQQLRQLAHTLKGSAANVGALLLRDLSEELQLAAEQQNNERFIFLSEKIATTMSTLETHLHLNGIV